MIDELVSPSINKDNSVTFNLKSGFANNVSIGGEFRLGRTLHGPEQQTPIESVSMEKGNTDVWNYTTDPVLPGIYRYFFVVDGLRTLDPLNPWKDVTGTFSMVKVKGKETLPWDVIPTIPHGTIVIEKFYCETLRQLKRCSIYLPPNYHLTKERYPVLYLLHGGGDDHASWIFKGTADNIMDYLLAKKKAQERIVVMPDGHIISDEELLKHRRLRSTRKEQQQRKERDVIRSMVSQEHINYFVKDLIPFVENKYRISRDARTVAGLSMGGAQTLNLITAHPEMFQAAGMFSSGPAIEARSKLPQVQEQIRGLEPIYISCGSWDSILGYSRTLHNILEKLQIQHTYKETSDGGHFWSVWQRNLTEFISYL